jgi:hypothetical protein
MKRPPAPDPSHTQRRIFYPDGNFSSVSEFVTQIRIFGKPGILAKRFNGDGPFSRFAVDYFHFAMTKWGIRGDP